MSTAPNKLVQHVWLELLNILGIEATEKVWISLRLCDILIRHVGNFDLRHSIN